MKSIHNISDYGKNDNIKRKYDHPTFSDPSPIKNEYSRYSENKISEMKHYPNPLYIIILQIDFIVKEIIITGFIKL